MTINTVTPNIGIIIELLCFRKNNVTFNFTKNKGKQFTGINYRDK